MFEAEQRIGRQDERPDLSEVGVGETEGVEHGGDVGPGIGGYRQGCEGTRGLHGADALPEGGLGVDVGEEGAGDAAEERVEIGGGGLRERARAAVDFGDGPVGGGGFGDGPEDGVVLAGGE